MLRLARGALFIALLMSVSNFLFPFFTFVNLCYTKALEGSSSLVPGPEAKSSSETMNLTPFTISYHCSSVLA